MRIAIIADAIDDQTAGIHIYVTNLIKALSELDKSNTYLIIRNKKGPPISTFKEIVVPHTSGFLIKKAYRLLHTIPNICVKWKADVVFEPAHFGPFNLPKKIKRVVFIHDLSPILFPHYHNWHSQLLQRVFLPKIMKKAHLILTNSYFTQSEIGRKFPQIVHKTKVTYLAPNSFGESAVNINNNKPVLNKKHRHILYLGTLEPRKGIDILIKAFDQLKKRPNTDDVKLLLVGKWGWKTKKIKRAMLNSKYNSEIIQSGYIPNEHLPYIYKNCSMLVYPSRYEGFGLPIIEAMKNECACILAKNSSLVEIGEKAALYFETDDVNQLCEKMHTLLKDKDLKEALINKGVNRAQFFNWQKTAQSTLEYFQNV